jgi:hypothetical protein
MMLSEFFINAQLRGGAAVACSAWFDDPLSLNLSLTSWRSYRLQSVRRSRNSLIMSLASRIDST